MCGRYTLGRSTKEILQRYAIQQVNFDTDARYNIAPSQMVPAVFECNGERTMQMLKWGLVPGWVKDLKKHKPLINARAESLAEKPSFKQALAKRRCIIPADGFFEWTGSAANRIPMYIRMASGKPFSFAGIWEQWVSSSGEVIRSCAIITVAANELVSSIHDRMPAILCPEDESLWLSTEQRDLSKIVAVLKPFPADQMIASPVSRVVNSPAKDSPECIEPAELKA